MSQTQRSHHILPSASTMLGVCLTGIGLVKVAEADLGPTHVDEYLALTSLVFLVSCICSYASIRQGDQKTDQRAFVIRLEQMADVFFMFGLVVMAVISVVFAYELV